MTIYIYTCMDITCCYISSVHVHIGHPICTNKMLPGKGLHAQQSTSIVSPVSNILIENVQNIAQFQDYPTSILTAGR